MDNIFALIWFTGIFLIAVFGMVVFIIVLLPDIVEALNDTKEAWKEFKRSGKDSVK